MAVFHDLCARVGTLSRDVGIARGMESPNPEDDLVIKTAIVGFSYHSRPEEWGIDHYRAIKRDIDGDYALARLERWGAADKIQLFFALCLGYLLGLYQAGKIDDVEFQIAEVQIPGIIALHCGEISRLRMA